MTTRNHHYVPQCYLRGFTPERARESRLKVVDKERQTHFTTIPRNVAAERDFNRVDIEGHPPDALEAGYAEFEAELAPALQRIDEVRNVDNEVDLNYLLNFIALLGVRTPRFRKKMDGAQQHMAKIIMDIMMSSNELHPKI